MIISLKNVSIFISNMISISNDKRYIYSWLACLVGDHLAILLAAIGPRVHIYASTATETHAASASFSLA